MNGNELVGCHLVLYNKSEEIKFPYQMTFMSFNGNSTGVTCESGTASHSGAPEFTPVFDGVRVARSLVLCVMFCRSLFVLFLLAIILSHSSIGGLWYLQTFLSAQDAFLE